MTPEHDALVDAINDDPLLLLNACSAIAGRNVLEEVQRVTAPETRHSDGFVLQHVRDDSVAVTTLAQRLGVSQQAASKQVADMERRGLVQRYPNPQDRRSQLVELTPLGQQVIDAGRAARSTVASDIETLLGPRKAAAFHRALQEISEHWGAAEAMARREIRP